MREIDREASIKRTKLVKKTTLVTLLVAATMILSGAVTGLTVNVNENVETIEDEVAPLSAPDDTGLVPTDIAPEIKSMDLEDVRPFEGTYRGEVVWDNGMEAVNLLASHQCSAYDALVADDFHFEEDTDVADMHWVGGYWNGVTAPFPWVITFYEDDGTGTSPGDVFAGPFEFPDDKIKKVDLGDQYFEFSVLLPEVLHFTGCEKYWVSAHGAGEFPPQSGFGAHDHAILNEVNFLSVYFGYPTWTQGSTVFGVMYDAAFQLTGAPEHDVGVTEIKSPESGGMECGCLPVEVTVANMGINDETGVDVTVEIRHYQWQDGFEEGEPFWDLEFFGPDYDCCDFQYVGAETAFPFVVTPRSGSFMLELDQVGCVYGWADAGTIYPTDFSCKCNPRFSFWMWHDEYGSDDHIDVWMYAGGWYKIAGPIYRNDCDPGCPPGWKQHIIDLSAFAHDPNPVWFLFEGICDMPMDGYNLHIDDVACYDLEYEASTEIDIPSGEEMQVEFPCWTPCKWQVIKNEYWDFEVIACALLEETCADPKDQIPDNNCLTKIITLLFPCFHDVGGYSIISPPPCGDPVPAQTFDMIGTIKNFGQYEECCFDTYMRVYETEGEELIFEEDFEDDDYNWPPISDCGAWNIDKATDNWRIDTYGSCPYGNEELQFYYVPYGAVVDSLIYTCMIDTTGYPCINIEFEHYLSHYSGPYTLSVECSTDGENWQILDQWVNPQGWDCTNEFYQTCMCTGGPFYLGFRFSNGDPWDLNYWDIDDIKVSGVLLGDMVWEEHYCVEEIDVCEELEIDFGEWTPVSPDPCYCGPYKFAVCIEADMCTYDQTPENDMFCKCVEVIFQHDVGIDGFTSPCETPMIGGPILWSQPPHGPGDYWSAATSHEGYGYKVYDNFWDMYDPHEIPGYLDVCDVHWYGFAGIFEDCTGWVPCDGCTLNFDIGFYEDDGGLPGAEVCYYEDVPATCTDTGIEYTTDLWYLYYWETDLDPCCPIPVDGWISIQSTGSGDCAFLWLSSPVGDGQSFQEGNVMTSYDRAFNLTGAEAGQPPRIDCYIPCGEDDLCVMVTNFGTYDEECTVYFELYIWDEDLEALVLVAEGSEDVSLAAGASEEVCLLTYAFDPCGIYFAWVWIDPNLYPEHEDCMPCNNYDGLGIGVDCCPPESCHDLNPIEPDGENNWYTKPVQVHLYADEPCTCCTVHSGIDKIVYILDGVEDFIDGGDGTFTISEDGVHHVEYYAVDNVGHEEVTHHSFEVAIDASDPAVELIFAAYQDDGGNWKVDFTALASDDISGMNRVEFFIGTELQTTVAAPGPYKWTVDWQDDYKTKTFYAYAYDDAGNAASDDVYGGDIPTAKSKDTQSQSKTTSTPVNLNRVAIRGI
jgi:hypothetical protein